MQQLRQPPAYQSWMIWGLGVTFYFSGFFHRMVTAVVADRLMAEFGIGAAALGNFSSFYYYSYVAVQIPTGILADHWGPRRLLTVGTLLSSIGAVVFALAPSIQVANLGRLIIGAAIGTAWVSILKLTTRWFPPERYALLTGLALSLGILGALSAGAPLRLLLERFGWRPIILAAGGVTLLQAGLVWVFVRDDPADKGFAGCAPRCPEHPRARDRTVLGDLHRVLQHRNTWILTVAPASLVGPLLTFSGLWGIPYLVGVYGFSPLLGAMLTATPLVAWAAGGPLLGALSEAVGRRKPVFFGSLCVALAAWVPILFLPDLPLWSIFVLLAAAGGASSAIVVGFAFIKESVPAESAGTVTGICNMGMETGPMLLQPAIGWVLDCRWRGALENGIRTYAPGDYHLAFGLMIALSLVGALIVPFAEETRCRQRA